MNSIYYNQETEVLTATLNGVTVRIDGFQFYLWADRNGMTRTGEEIAFMDGNSMSYTFENDERMEQEQFFEETSIDHEDIRDYIRDGGSTL